MFSYFQISDQLADSILYLDAGCLEAFHFIGAFPVLLELGVHAVCSLENASPLDMVMLNSHYYSVCSLMFLVSPCE